MRFSRRLFTLLLLFAIGLTAACSDRDVDADDNAATDQTEQTARPTVTVDESAPDPLPVEADDLEMIEEWQEARIPRFEDGDVLDFSAHASTIENGGTLLLDGDNATAAEIIGFYRGALSALDFEERRVSGNELSARSHNASILITVTEFEDQTHILMILTDAPG